MYRIYVTFGDEVGLAKVVDVGVDLDARRVGRAAREAEAVAHRERLAVHDARRDRVRLHHDAHVRLVLNDFLLNKTTTTTTTNIYQVLSLLLY